MPNYSGSWTLDQQFQAQGAGVWPSYYGPQDQYFYDVSMLLPGSGTNGAQNNTFLDSSSNALTITRNGNTTQGTFSPYGNLWSNLFGSVNTEYITASTGTAFNFGTSNFTIEFWFCGTPTAYGVLFEIYNGSSAALAMVQANATGNRARYVQSGSTDIATTTNPFDNNWHHHAIVRSSGTVTYYIDGVSNGTGSSPSITGTASCIIGNYSQTKNYYMNGYISNLRVVNGTALYTSNFTPSTTPLTAVSGTSLLTCQSNRFIDNSSNNFTLTVNGTPSVQRFSPFNPTAPYSAATIGGSGYFDGAGDYLTATSSSLVPSTTSTPLTLEAWVYPTTSSGNYIISSEFSGSAVGYTLMLGDTPDSTATTNVIFACYGGGFGWRYVKSTQQIKLNTWTHIAGVFTGSTSNIFINGVLTDTGGASSWLTTGSSTVRIGYRWDEYNAPYYFTGYISDARITIGTAVYSSTFTLPTAPLAPVTNTRLLTNFTNAGIPDMAMVNNIETIGTAQVSTSVSKYGTGSLYFNTANSGLRVQYINLPGDFTIETWVYQTTGSGDPYTCLFAGSYQVFIDGTSGGGTSVGTIGIYTAGTFVISSAGVFQRNQWNHVAWVRQNGVVTIYYNGVNVASGTATQAGYVTTIGSYSGNSYTLQGYMDDARITTGYARYTANFTPPTAAFPTY